MLGRAGTKNLFYVDVLGGAPLTLQDLVEAVYMILVGKCIWLTGIYFCF